VPEPIITDQPDSTAATLGGGATFSVTAIGSGLTYQWERNGFPLVDGPCRSGVLTPTLVLCDLQPDEAGDYTCIVAAPCRSTISDVATLVIGCDTIDFNRDGLFPDTQDIADFLTVFGGGACPRWACGDIDFNNDGLFPDTADITGLLSVFSGGTCL